jgi:hypothetical protein
MLKNLTIGKQASGSASLARAFSRWGWSGFWALLGMGSVPFIIMVYTFFFSDTSSGGLRSGLPLVHFLASFGLLLLVFLALWFYRYTRIAKRIHDPARRPSASSLRRTVWTGVVTTNLAILFSMLVLLFEVGTMLFHFLSAPQAGLPTIQTTTDVPSWVSTVDMLNLMSVILSLGGEIFALIFGLLLLFRTLQETAQSTVAPEASRKESPQDENLSENAGLIGSGTPSARPSSGPGRLARG